MTAIKEAARGSEVTEGSETSWFSTNIRLICLVKPKGATEYRDIVFLFRAKDWDDAFVRALELGRSQEEEYVNANGQRVRWRLKEIISIDIVQAESLDGAEVYSEPVDLAPGESIPFDAEFHPERSTPTQTV